MDRVSKSSLSVWLKCKRQYYYSLLGFKQVTSPEMQYGLDFHELLADYNRKCMKENKLVTNFKVPEKFVANFEAYVKFLNVLPTQGYNPVAYGIEIPVSFKGMFGFIDAVFSGDNGRYLIVDYKTIPNFNGFDETRYQPELFVYDYIYSQMYKVGLDKLQNALLRFQQNGILSDQHFINIDRTGLDAVISDVDEMLEFINKSSGKAEDFPIVDVTRKSWICRYCPYYNKCVEDVPIK